MLRVCVFLVMIALLTGLRETARAEDPVPASQEEFLKVVGIGNSYDGLNAFLSNGLSDAQKEIVKKFIAQLGSENFKERERAQIMLSFYDLQIKADLELAAQSSDLEIKNRAAALLQQLPVTSGQYDRLTVKAVATRALGELNDPRAVVLLARLMKEDAELQTRKNAAEALAKFDNAEAWTAFPPAIQRENDVHLRNQMLTLLGDGKNPTALAQLLNIIQNTADGEICCKGLELLLKRPEPTMPEKFLELAVKSKHQAAFVESLGQFTVTEQNAPAFFKALESSDEIFGNALCRILVRSGQEKSLDKLLEMFGENIKKNSPRALMIGLCLLSTDRPGYIAKLYQKSLAPETPENFRYMFLPRISCTPKHPEEGVKCAQDAVANAKLSETTRANVALLLLKKNTDEKTMKISCNLFEEMKGDYDRLRLAMELGKNKCPRVAPYLANMLKTNSPMHRQRAYQTLKHLSGKNFPMNDLVAWENWAKSAASPPKP